MFGKKISNKMKEWGVQRNNELNIKKAQQLKETALWLYEHGDFEFMEKINKICARMQGEDESISKENINEVVMDNEEKVHPKLKELEEDKNLSDFNKKLNAYYEKIDNRKGEIEKILKEKEEKQNYIDQLIKYMDDREKELNKTKDQEKGLDGLERC